MIKTNGGYLLSRVKQVSGRVFDRMLSESGVSAFNGAQGRILYALWQREGVSISELAKHTGLTNATLTSMLDRMAASGLISRNPDINDRRKYLIELTDMARSLRREYDRISDDMSERFYAGFSDDEIAEFENYLERIYQNLKEE